MIGSVTDRAPRLDQLVRAEDLSRTLAAFMGGVLTSTHIFDKEGRRFLRTGPDGQGNQWSQLPREAEAAERAGDNAFFCGGQRLFRAPLYAGADRVGTAIFEVSEDDPVQQQADLERGLVQMLGTLLQAGFATWVTSELHRAAV